MDAVYEARSADVSTTRDATSLLGELSIRFDDISPTDDADVAVDTVAVQLDVLDARRPSLLSPQPRVETGCSESAVVSRSLETIRPLFDTSSHDCHTIDPARDRTER